MRLTERNVVITGSSSGIGEALAHEVARRGGHLVLGARRVRRLEAIADDLRKAGAIAHAVRCDVSDSHDVRALLDQARKRLGSIDVLINNAGISVYGTTERTGTTDFSRLLAVNLMGPWYAMREVIPMMRQQGGGVVVNVASVAALHGPPYLGAYAATKAGLAALTQSLRAELAPDGIRLMVVHPGYTDTDIFSKERQLGGARRPSLRYAAPDRVARAIARGIERGRCEIILSREGHGLAFLKRFVPAAADFAMRRVAAALRLPTEVTHVKTKTADHCLISEPR